MALHENQHMELGTMFPHEPLSPQNNRENNRYLAHLTRKRYKTDTDYTASRWSGGNPVREGPRFKPKPRKLGRRTTFWPGSAKKMYL